MEPQEKLTAQQFIIDRLNDAIRKAEGGRIDDALSVVKEAKAADTKNIYIIAFEKQVAKLSDLNIAPEAKAEIAKSLQPMVDRAIADSQRRMAVKPAEAQAQHSAQEKQAALEKLKSQYFQRADDYVEKGDYHHALEEIRRIYIIEPESVVAKEYEQKIQQLAVLNAKPSISPADISAVKETPVEAVAERQASYSIGEESAEERKSKLPILIGAAVVVVAIGAWLMLSKKSGEPTDHVASNQQSSESIPQLPTGTVVTPQSSGQTQSSDQATVKDSKEPPAEPQPLATPKNQKQTVAEPKLQPQQTKSIPVEPPVAHAQQQTQPPVTLTSSSQPQASQPPPQPPAQASAEAPKREAVPRPFVAIESNAELIRFAAPRYPEIAFRTRVEGRVYVEVTIDPQGKPVQARVVKSSSSIFEDAAVEAAMKSTFKPAMMSTGPVVGKITLPIDFKLPR